MNGEPCSQVDLRSGRGRVACTDAAWWLNQFVPNTSSTSAAPVLRTFRPKWMFCVIVVWACPSWSAADLAVRPASSMTGRDGLAEDVGGDSFVSGPSECFSKISAGIRRVTEMAHLGGKDELKSLRVRRLRRAVMTGAGSPDRLPRGVYDSPISDHIDAPRRQFEHALARLCFRPADDPVPCFDPQHCSSDRHGADSQVDISPAECADLADPSAAGDQKAHQVPKVPADSNVVVAEVRAELLDFLY